MTAYWRNDWSDLKSRYIMVDFIKSSNIIEESIKKNIPKRPGNKDIFKETFYTLLY